MAARWSRAGIAAAGALLLLPGSFFACPVHLCTGLLCPGCGATRALFALLHGDLRHALALNSLFVCVLLPGALLYGLLAWRRGFWIRLPAPFVAALTVATVAFTVTRNLA